MSNAYGICPLDQTAYPHIVDNVIFQGDHSALLPLRRVSRSVCAKVDDVLARHLVLSKHKGQLLVSSPQVRLPLFQTHPLRRGIDPALRPPARWAAAAASAHTVTLIFPLPPFPRTAYTDNTCAEATPRVVQLFSKVEWLVEAYDDIPPQINLDNVHALVVALPGVYPDHDMGVLGTNTLVLHDHLLKIPKIVLHAAVISGIVIMPTLAFRNTIVVGSGLRDLVLVLHPVSSPVDFCNDFEEVVSNIMSEVAQWYRTTQTIVGTATRLVPRQLTDAAVVRFTIVGAFEVACALQPDIDFKPTTVANTIQQSLASNLSEFEFTATQVETLAEKLRILGMDEYREEIGKEGWEDEMVIPGGVGMPWEGDWVTTL